MIVRIGLLFRRDMVGPGLEAFPLKIESAQQKGVKLLQDRGFCPEKGCCFCIYDPSRWLNKRRLQRFALFLVGSFLVELLHQQGI